MELSRLVKMLREFADLDLASNSPLYFDNAGLLVEPSGPLKVQRVLLTNDLTEKVLEEALLKKANMIISYHPVILDPLKRLTQSEWEQRSIVNCLKNRIAVFSPHTSWDSLNGGINDWILKTFGKL
jgi:putative NIF3 family GTP cyclohydrolase 1 type 2